jgi:hypothetical protein
MNTSLAFKLPASVTAKSASPLLSERYVYVDSSKVVESMLAAGFVVAHTQTSSPRARNPLYARHSIDFRRPGAKMGALKVGDIVPRILFTNSHDGSSRATAIAGVFRLVCSNGMLSGTAYAREALRHVGDPVREMVTRMEHMADSMGPMFAQIEDWQKKQLSKAQSREFARLASMLRWGDPHRFAPEDLLAVRRPEDDRGDLWTTFNRVQEATVRGGITGVSRTGRATRARELTAIAHGINFNQQLWTLAEEFAEM